MLWLPFKWSKDKVYFSLIKKFCFFTNYSIINIEFLYFIAFISLSFLTQKAKTSFFVSWKKVEWVLSIICEDPSLWHSRLLTSRHDDIEFFEAILLFIVCYSCTISLTERRRFVIPSFHRMKSFCRVISSVLSSAAIIIWHLSLRKERQTFQWDKHRSLPKTALSSVITVLKKKIHLTQNKFSFFFFSLHWNSTLGKERKNINVH